MVYVLHQDGTPLMPTSPAKARHLLDKGEAEVVRGDLFAIRLVKPCGKHVSRVRLGIDWGANETGFAAIDLDNWRVLYQGQVILRQDIHNRMETRANARRSRRHRKLRYRSPRFNNRASARRTGRPRQPSIASRSDTVIKVVKRIMSFLPISEIWIEDAEFDTHAMRAGHRLRSWEYQRGDLYQQENVKKYVWARDEYTCQYCEVKNPLRLECDHVVPRSRGGSDAAWNRVAACHDCNQRKGNKTAAEFGKPKIQQRVDERSHPNLKYAAYTQQGKNYTLRRLEELVPVTKTYGYITKVDRQKMGLAKTHFYDAVAIASGGRSVELLGWVEKMKAVSRGQRQQFKANPSKGHVFRACRLPYEVFGFRMWDKVQLPDGTIGFVGARRKTGSFRIRDIDGQEIKGGITYKKLVLLERAKTLAIQIEAEEVWDE